jgi:four helix bundle protein
MKISHKETKETEFWLHLIIEANPEFKTKIILLLNESIELRKILSSIIINSQNKNK